MEKEEENRLEKKLDKYFELMMGEIQKRPTKDEVHEIVHEIVDERFDQLEKKMDDGFTAVTSRMGGVDNRIDNEVSARKDLENRVRSVVPSLPLAPERV